MIARLCSSYSTLRISVRHAGLAAAQCSGSIAFCTYTFNTRQSNFDPNRQHLQPKAHLILCRRALRRGVDKQLDDFGLGILGLHRKMQRQLAALPGDT